MKININGIEVEGTPAEVAELLASMTTTPSTAHPQLSDIREKVSENKFVKASEPPVEALTNEQLYVRALYRYRPNKNSSSGKAPYVVELLTSGDQYSIRQLCRLAQADQSLVSRAIRRAADGGCTIEVSSSSTSKLTLNTKVRLVSIGTIEQAKSTRTSSLTSKVKTYVHNNRPMPEPVQKMIEKNQESMHSAQHDAIFRLLNKNKDQES